jgi:hypothetical protein
MPFKFELGQKVTASTGFAIRPGVIIARTEYVTGLPPAYFIEFPPEHESQATLRAWRDEDLICEYEEPAAT